MNHYVLEKFPKDHDWEFSFNIDDLDYNSAYRQNYDILYNVFCKKCNIFIRQSICKLIHNIYDYDYFIVSILDQTRKFSIKNIYSEDDRNKIDYSKVYSCKEMLIKNIIE